MFFGALSVVCLLAAWMIPERNALAGTMSAQERLVLPLHPDAGKPRKAPKPPGGRSPGIVTVCSSHGVEHIFTSNPKDSRVTATRQYLHYADRAITIYEQHLKPVLGVPICVRWPTHYVAKTITTLTVSNASGGMTGTAASCWIDVNPAGFSGTSPRNILPSLQYRLAFRAFECYEAVLAGLDRYFHPPYGDWVHWGMGEWATAHVAPDPELTTPWKEYLRSPETSLFARTFDAIGFYAHLAESGTDPWSVMKHMLVATDNVDAFREAGADAPAFLDTWASSLFRFDSFGKAWDTTGPGIPNSTEVNAQKHIVSLGLSTTQADVAGYTEGLFIVRVQPAVEIMDVKPVGHTRLSDSRLDQIVSAHADYCVTADPCRCPAGTAYEGPALVRLSTSLLAIAVTGGPDGAKLDIAGQRMKDLCKPTQCTTGSPGTITSRQMRAGSHTTSAQSSGGGTSSDSCAPCPVGSWKVTDGANWVNWQLAHDTGGLGRFVSFTGMAGDETLSIAANGTAILSANNFGIGLRKDDGSTDVLLQNGSASSHWSLPQSGQLRFSGISPGNFTDVLTGSGQTSSVNLFPILTPWSFGLPQAYECSASTLQLHVLTDTSTPAVILSRIS